jgi:hypothetical protein
MKMRGKGSGSGRFLVVMVWVLATLGWMDAGAAQGQEALSKVEVVSADTAKVSPGGATCREKLCALDPDGSYGGKPMGVIVRHITICL